MHMHSLTSKFELFTVNEFFLVHDLKSVLVMGSKNTQRLSQDPASSEEKASHTNTRKIVWKDRAKSRQVRGVGRKETFFPKCPHFYNSIIDAFQLAKF